MATKSPVLDELRDEMRPGAHLCVIFDDNRLRTTIAAQYLKGGLERGECAIYSAGQTATAEIIAELAMQGVDAPHEQAHGALQLPTADATYLESGSTPGQFNPAEMLGVFRRTLASAIDAGFTACRFAGEPTWGIRRPDLVPALVEFEALLNDFFPSQQATGLCLYDRRSWPASVIREVLRTHAVVVVNDLVCRNNPFYERPDLVLEAPSDEERVDWMLSRLGAARQRERTLEDENQGLRESHRRKDEFLSALSNELRNSLAPLRNGLYVLRTNEPPDSAGTPIHEMMERQVDHLVHLVDDLLEMSHLAFRTFELRKERVDMAAIVRRAIEMHAHLIQSAGHRITVSLPPEPLWVNGDPVRLVYIVGHLLSNAATYTDPGGQIWIDAERKKNLVLITLRDTGVGMTSDALARAFVMFNRSDTPAVRRGLGIGLSLARHMVEMHGGTIVARSEGPGKGSEFTVRLPLIASGEMVARVDPTAGEPLTRQRVLVVDDNRDAGDTLSLVLKGLGADVWVARCGGEALAVLQDYQPSAVLLDIEMPGMDGYEVARQIRSRLLERTPTLVAVTGRGQSEDQRRAREAGFDHHMTKPVDLGVLVTLLSSLTR